MKQPWQRPYGMNNLGRCSWEGADFLEWNLVKYMSVALKEIIYTVVVVIIFPGFCPKEKLKFNTKIYI